MARLARAIQSHARESLGPVSWMAHVKWAMTILVLD